ncbi:MAG: exodeoxyribonuclease VII small subunit [Elusimicrobiota bacterium]|nr:exodeoxyribonuclease VII small subunit [Elusimicrobiota bacterium]
MENKNLNYSKALEELKSILEELENENIEIDDLSSKVKRSAELIKFCREKLKKTELEIEKILKEFEENSELKNKV